MLTAKQNGSAQEDKNCRLLAWVLRHKQYERLVPIVEQRGEADPLETNNSWPSYRPNKHK